LSAGFCPDRSVSSDSLAGLGGRGGRRKPRKGRRGGERGGREREGLGRGGLTIKYKSWLWDWYRRARA